MFLDTVQSISSRALGYNMPEMLALAKSDEMAHLIANRTSLGLYPPKNWPDLLERAYANVAPKGFTYVTTTMCGSCSVEGSFKYAFMARAARDREGGQAGLPTQEELDSCMLNMSPGTKNYAILSLQDGFHGTLLGSLSATRFGKIRKVDIPAFDWPAAKPPAYKYPLHENEAFNRQTDIESLEDIKAKIAAWKQKGSEVVAIVFEPFLSAGGDHQISAWYAN